MARSESKKQTAEPEKPRKTAAEPSAPNEGDGLAHDVALIEVEMPNDLEHHPGIGASKGATTSGANADDLDEQLADGENTFEGDVENDAGRPGVGVDGERVGRQSKQGGQ
jgi:hypothetical protein